MPLKRTRIASTGINTKSNGNVSPYSLQAQIEIDKFYKDEIKKDRKNAK